jgi:hypothetical protein
MAHYRQLSGPIMRRVRRGLRIVMPLAAVGLCLVLALPALAAPGSRQASLHTAANSAGHVTVIVLDMSGSMAQNDPNGLRCSAANAYIDLSGPGDFVGVVGLAMNGTASDAQGFPAAVNWGLAPRELATVAARQTLRNAIAQKSHNCAAAGNTPTYDALAQAQAMLASATQNGTNGMSGSVILLTDGIPYPNANGQVSAIQKTLLPAFKAHDWPVDTIALGSDQSFHGFLSDLSSATSGNFYDDGRGVVAGVSPLNITPFFLQIFRVRNNRSPGPDIPPTTLGSGVTARNFSVGAYVSHLDIVVVKDSPSTIVSLVAPNGQRFPPAAAGTFVSTDPHYAIFAVDSPQPGAWEVDVHGGSGQFLMDSLKVSTLALNLVAPTENSVLALGEPLTLSASLSNQGSPVSGGQYSLSGRITFSGGSGTYVQDVQLSDPNGTGVYSAPVTIPVAAPPGSYTFTVTAHSASEDVITTQRVVRFELFPTPVLYTPGTSTPASGAIAASAVAWDPVLSLLYRLPVVSALGGWALGGHTAQPSVVLHGQVQLKGQPYPNATVSGSVVTPHTSAANGGSQHAPPIAVTPASNGAFQLVFPAATSGSYALDLTTAGAFAQTHGDLTHVTRAARVTVVAASAVEEIRAWAFTVFYLLVLVLLVLLVRFAFAQKPFGELAGGDGGQEFARARRSPLSALLHPGQVTSRQMGLDSGVLFLFRRGGRILVRGSGDSRHFELAGRRLPDRPVPAAEAELRYDEGSETLTYIIRSQVTGDALDEDDEPGSRPRGVMERLRGPRPDVGDRFDDDGDRPRRKALGGLGALFAGRRARAASGDDDDWEESPRRSGTARGVTGGRRRWADDEDDDDWAPRSRRARATARDDADDGDEGHGSRRSRGSAPTRNSSSGKQRSRGRYDDDDVGDEGRSSGMRRTARRRAYDDDDDW